jgi:putative Mg2+ transporter-C (MgtC) family protein
VAVHEWEWTLVGRMALAAALGFVIGFERELRGKSAGTRTFALIGLGTAGIVALGAELSGSALSRIVQGVAAGIGFIGAGLIFQRERGMVHGLTTAAAVWAAAALGVLCGAGLYVAAIAGTALVLLVLELDEIPGLRRLDAGRLRGELGADRDRHDEKATSAEGYPAQRPVNALARSHTASSISGVSLPVKVFCWLGWKLPRIV